MLNALTLGAGAVLGGKGSIDLGLAFRVGVAALVTAGFTMFVADYAARRAELVRASRQLNMTEPGRLAATHLGRRAASQSVVAMAVAGISSLVGAVVPLAVGATFPTVPILVLGLTIAGLGLLGWTLARLIAGNRLVWSLGMLGGGAVIAVVGSALHIA